jgi:Tol biopolymer transport system component
MNGNPVSEAHSEIAGRYRVDALLGEGGMGKVYRAWDQTLRRNVAIKVLPPEVLGDRNRVSRFIQEARAASALNHPHVVTVFDVGDTEGLRYIVMELVEGATLRTAAAREPLELRKTLRLVTQVAEALGAAHDAGIVHRDLKPENIMVTRDGYAKVLDFGLAKLRMSDEPAPPDSSTAAMNSIPGGIMGTPAYMSPEQARGLPADHRTDLFSLGSVLYELTTGRRPFPGASRVDVLANILHAEPEPVRSLRPDAPPELGRVIRKAMAKDPGERYQTARDLAIDLRELTRELESAPATGARALRAISKPARWIGIAIAALVIAIAAFLVRSRPEAPPQALADAVRRPGTTVIKRVTATGKVIGAAISADGKFVAYVQSDRGQQSLWVRQLGSNQSLELIPPARVGFWGVSFAPDGSIFFGLKTATPPDDALFQISPLGGSPNRIVSEVDSAPTFSPDGKQLAFLRSSFPGPTFSSLIVCNADGSGERTLFSIAHPEAVSPILFAKPSWSPDGKSIAVAVHHRVRATARLLLVDVVSGAATPLGKQTWPSASALAWLPDQTGLIAIAGDVGWSQVWHIRTPSGEASPITNDLLDYRGASATADGRSLLTVAQDISSNVWICREGEAPRRLTSAKLEGAYGLDTLPDGRIVTTSLETGKTDLWIMAEDGTGRRLLTRGDSINAFPAVRPDGKSILYVSAVPGAHQVSRLDLDASRPEVLARTGQNGTVDIAPDGRWFVYNAVSEEHPPVLTRMPWREGEPTAILSAAFFAVTPAISPDGTRVAAYVQPRIEGPGSLQVVSAAGGEVLHKLDFAPPFFRSQIRWAADGRGLVVNTAPGDRGNLWLLPLDGSQARRLTNFEDQTIFAFAPLRRGSGWVVARGEQSRDALLITGFR